MACWNPTCESSQTHRTIPSRENRNRRTDKERNPLPLPARLGCRGQSDGHGTTARPIGRGPPVLLSQHSPSLGTSPPPPAGPGGSNSPAGQQGLRANFYTPRSGGRACVAATMARPTTGPPATRTDKGPLTLFLLKENMHKVGTFSSLASTPPYHGSLCHRPSGRSPPVSPPMSEAS